MTFAPASDNLHLLSIKETSLKRFLIIAAATLSCSAWAQTTANSAPTPAQNAQTLNIRSLAATCANCHGTNGKAVEGSAVVTLAGMPKDYIVAQMKAFKTGTRPATIMHQLSKGYSDAQIEQIATYFAAQKK
ncbi:MAG: c-type cytochrome [Brachymonas sp.]|nr:c-type cytochrome [Brachymonas sp.]